jgi:hypothetical protein
MNESLHKNHKAIYVDDESSEQSDYQDQETSHDLSKSVII